MTCNHPHTKEQLKDLVNIGMSGRGETRADLISNRKYWLRQTDLVPIVREMTEKHLEILECDCCADKIDWPTPDED